MYGWKGSMQENDRHPKEKDSLWAGREGTRPRRSTQEVSATSVSFLLNLNSEYMTVITFFMFFGKPKKMFKLFFKVFKKQRNLQIEHMGVLF